MKNTVWLSVLVLSLFSFGAVAKVKSTDSKVLVKKYYSGKPGYNRRIVKVYQKDIFDKINRQLVLNPSAAGDLSRSYTKNKSLFRQHRMKTRRHP